MSAAEVKCSDQLRDCRPPPESPSRTARFQTVERQLPEGEQQRTSKLSAIGLAAFGEFMLDGTRLSSARIVRWPQAELINIFTLFCFAAAVNLPPRLAKSDHAVDCVERSRYSRPCGAGRWTRSY